MKRIGLSLVLPVVGSLFAVATPATAFARGWGGGGGGHAAPAAHAAGGWHGAAVTRPSYMPHVAAGGRAFAAHPVYGGHPGYAGHPGYVGRPAYGWHVGPVAGHWGWHGAARVWVGVSTYCPYPGWIWTPGIWAWDGYQWVWQDGYWAPPAY
jgi:hypothetical protein